MGVILITRNTNDNTNSLSSPTVNRKSAPLYDRAIIFKNYGWQFENQREPPHITMDRANYHSLSLNNAFREPTHEVEPLPFSTPGPTPLRTHITSTSSTEHSGTTSTILPSLLPVTGTTLIIPPQPLSSTIRPTDTTSMDSDIATEISTPYEPFSSSLPSIMATSTKIKLRLPIPAIAAIAAGGLCALIGCLVLFFWLRTPPRRRLPTPSLPKLEDGDMDEKDSPQESPLFGPKERFSQQRPGLHPQWSWVTYPQNNQDSRLPGDNDTAVFRLGGSTTAPRPPAATVASCRRSSSIYPVSGHFQSLSAPVGSPPLCAGHPSLQQVQAAITRATNHMSAMSFTCASNYPNEKGSGTPYTADGHDVMKRRSRTLRKSRSNSIYEDRRRSSRLPAGLAYDGADVTSPIPAMEFLPLESPGPEDGYDLNKVERRTRIQTPYYTPASYPRISSAIPTTYGVATRVKLGEGTSIRDAKSLKSKSESQRAKETQALTRALGLGSPGDCMPSPQPTLCPDDSLSVVESKRFLKQRSKRGSTYLGDDGQSNQVSDGRRQQLIATPTRSVVAVASGSLVSAEDIKALASRNNNPDTGLAVSLTGPTLVNSKSMGTKSTLASSKIEGRAADKPPRVPSPPPLPSLAQMALEQHNPDAYANYRSPTYSIYNLYDDNRRSTIYGGKR